MRNWKTPPERHLNWAIQIMHRDVILRTHGHKYHHSNNHSNCSIQMITQVVHFALMWKQSIGPFSFVNTTIIKFATIYWIATTLSTFIRKTAIISLPQISRFFRHVLRVRTWLIMPIPVKCHVTDNFAMFLATEFTLQNLQVVYSRK